MSGGAGNGGACKRLFWDRFFMMPALQSLTSGGSELSAISNLERVTIHAWRIQCLQMCLDSI